MTPITTALETIKRFVQRTSLFIGPLAALVLFHNLPDQYPGPSGEMVVLTQAGRATLAVMLWMALWWLLEAVHITVTALLPLALFPLFGIANMSQAAAPYANPLIFLFL